MKGEKKWTTQDNLESMGKISPPQWHKQWPTQKLPELTSPPQGRNYTHKKDKLHNISTDSDSSTQDNNKKTKLEGTNTMEKAPEEAPAQDNSYLKPEEGQVKAWAAVWNIHNKHTEAQ